MCASSGFSLAELVPSAKLELECFRTLRCAEHRSLFSIMRCLVISLECKLTGLLPRELSGDCRKVKDERNGRKLNKTYQLQREGASGSNRLAFTRRVGTVEFQNHDFRKTLSPDWRVFT